jgi:putative transposase
MNILLTGGAGYIGRNFPSPWPELKGQILLGSEAFVAKMRPLLEGNGELTEIPRA